MWTMYFHYISKLNYHLLRPSFMSMCFNGSWVYYHHSFVFSCFFVYLNSNFKEQFFPNRFHHRFRFLKVKPKAEQTEILHC